MAEEDVPTSVLDAAHRTPVVAVFGGEGTEALEPARALGRWLVRRGCVVLTGGRGPEAEPYEPAVRRTALEGAQAGVESGGTGAWVEVERNDDDRADARRHSTHIVLRPGFGHRRNYVEAHLCDVGIALPGGDGTASEVAFCLALGRPVVLLGPGWRSDYEQLGADRTAVQDRLARTVDRRVLRRRAPAPWDSGVEQARRRLDDITWPLPPVVHADLPDDDEDAEAVVDTALDLLDLERLPGRMPLPRDPASAPDHLRMAQSYAVWLAGRAPFDPTTIRRRPRSC